MFLSIPWGIAADKHQKLDNICLHVILKQTQRFYKKNSRIRFSQARASSGCLGLKNKYLRSLAHECIDHRCCVENCKLLKVENIFVCCETGIIHFCGNDCIFSNTDSIYGHNNHRTCLLTAQEIKMPMEASIESLTSFMGSMKVSKSNFDNSIPNNLFENSSANTWDNRQSILIICILDLLRLFDVKKTILPQRRLKSSYEEGTEVHLKKNILYSKPRLMSDSTLYLRQEKTLLGRKQKYLTSLSNNMDSNILFLQFQKASSKCGKINLYDIFLQQIRILLKKEYFLHSPVSYKALFFLFNYWNFNCIKFNKCKKTMRKKVAKKNQKNSMSNSKLASVSKNLLFTSCKETVPWRVTYILIMLNLHTRRQNVKNYFFYNAFATRRSTLQNIDRSEDHLGKKRKIEEISHNRKKVFRSSSEGSTGSLEKQILLETRHGSLNLPNEVANSKVNDYEQFRIKAACDLIRKKHLMGLRDKENNAEFSVFDCVLQYYYEIYLNT